MSILYQYKQKSKISYFQNGGEFRNISTREINELLEPLAWGKYIEDPNRREQHIKDIFFNLLDSKMHPEQAEEVLRTMGSYGAEGRGKIAKDAAYFGYDSKDITREKLQNYYTEYTK